MNESVGVEDFISDTLADFKSPLESNFISKVSSIRQTIHSIDEGLDADKALVAKSLKFFKSVVTAGIAYVDSVLALCDHLEHLGLIAQSDDNNGSDLATGFWKFSVIHRDLGNMFKHLMQNLSSILIFPMETFLQVDLKSDLKKPFERAFKDYESKYDKLKKEKLQMMKETGIYTPETFTMEMAENLEKERRRLQLEVCEYFIKVNEVKSKKGSEFLQHFVDFYHAHLHYLKESTGVMVHFGKMLPDLANSISDLQKQHDTQKRQLSDTREAAKKLIEKEMVQPVNSGYSGTQPLPLNLSYGKQKNGFLLKKSESKVMKRLWQRRRVCVSDNGEFCLYHADETKPPVRLSLLTCRLKLPVTSAADAVSAPVASVEAPSTGLDSSDPPICANTNRRSFYLVSNNRTYHFHAEDERDFEEWTNVLLNAIQAVFHEAMHRSDWKTQSEGAPLSLPDQDTSASIHHHSHGNSLNGSTVDLTPSHYACGVESRSSRSSTVGSTEETATVSFDGLSGAKLHQNIQRVMRSKVPGNRVCADCNRPDPQWVSVNLGVLICLECCGTHRELGVQRSRTQSLVMDDLGATQLLLPRFIGNQLFNEVYESALVEGVKPNPDANSASRRAYIWSKYLECKFVSRLLAGDDNEDRFWQRQLLTAIRSADLRALLQVYAMGVDLTAPLSPSSGEAGDGIMEGDTPLHFTIAAAASVSASPKSRDAPLPETFLAIMQFILQNSFSTATTLQRTNSANETTLHYAVKFALPDALRLLLSVAVSSEGGGAGAGGSTLLTSLLTAVNELKQTALDVVEARLSTLLPSADVEIDALHRCEHLLQLATDAFAVTVDASAGTDYPLPAFLTSTATQAFPEARKQLLETLDNFEDMQWDILDFSLNHFLSSSVSIGGIAPLKEDVLNSALSKTPTEAIKMAESSFSQSSRRPHLSRDQWHADSIRRRHCRSFKSTEGSTAAAALATLPRKKGPAPLPPSAENLWFSVAETSRTSRTLAMPPSPSSALVQPTSDHIEVLLDVLEEHPSSPPSSPPLPSLQRVVALFDCDAENPDELTFRRTEVIVVLKDVEVNWWLGYVEGQPHRSGLFPLTHVKLLPT